jgi:hypothetical protein
MEPERPWFALWFARPGVLANELLTVSIGHYRKARRKYASRRENDIEPERRSVG